jgi:hypothetical protein
MIVARCKRCQDSILTRQASQETTTTTREEKMPALYQLRTPKPCRINYRTPRHGIVRRRKRRGGSERQRTSWTQKASWAVWVTKSSFARDTSRCSAWCSPRGAMQKQSICGHFLPRVLLPGKIHWLGEMRRVLSRLQEAGMPTVCFGLACPPLCGGVILGSNYVIPSTSWRNAPKRNAFCCGRRFAMFASYVVIVLCLL